MGRAPAFIVDMKAAIRCLRHNADLIPGNPERIITNGTSAGGALSALTGASGNAPEYQSYLDEIGAARERDDVFAAICYCPIHNLENADSAYEWLFQGHNTYKTMKFEKKDGQVFPTAVEGVQTEKQIAMSKELAHLFPDYLTVRDGAVADLDWNAFVNKIGRMKTTPAFDAIDLNSPECEEFGDEKVYARHFSKFSAEHDTCNGEMANAEMVRIMNPLSFIGSADTAPNWRIRHGAFDRDTSLAIPVILATVLQNKGFDVDFALPWGLPHSGDYDFEEQFAWIDSLC